MMNYFKFFTEVGNGEFVNQVCMAVLEELERCWKGREEE